MPELLASYWKGQEPLWKTFWVILILGSILYATSAIFIALIFKSLFPPVQIISFSAVNTTFLFINARDYSWPYLLVGLLLMPYVFFATICIWRSSDKSAARFWRDVARFFVSCYFIIICYRIVQVVIFYLGFSATAPELEMFLHTKPLQQVVFVFNHPQGAPQSLVTQEQVLNLAQTTLPELYTYNYQNYHEKFQQAAKNFSKNGWTRYVNFLTATDNPDLFAVLVHKLKVSVIAQNQPAILNKINYAGAHYWLVYLQMNVRFEPQGPETLGQKTVNASVLIKQSFDSPNAVIDGLMVF